MRLRSATMGDGGFLLDLKNDPVTRSFSVVTHDKIMMKDHLKWLGNHFDEIMIVMQDLTRVGMFRISREREVSINIRPEFRGQGLGKEVLSFCPENVWAKIVNGNIASMRLFLGAGFKITGYENNYYILKK